ncbi:MAG: phosphoenolpyruvate--protein phosphotransferase [Pseudomonadota bacterium]
MGEPGDGQSRLDRIVNQIAVLMVAEVSSIYVQRQDGSLELFATEGLRQPSVHQVHFKKGEGLVGRCAELAEPVNEPDAQNHPAFSYRPETGEEIYSSMLAVPILRAGQVLGVLTVQNRTRREYSDEDVEVLLTTAMVLAEHFSTGAVEGIAAPSEPRSAIGAVLSAQKLSEGLALGHIVLHQPRVVVRELLAEDPNEEAARLDAAMATLIGAIDRMLLRGDMARAGEHREVLESYRMFARDRGWLRRMKDAILAGLTAEAAVEKVQNKARATMMRQGDPFWRERVRDLDDLSDRLMRILAGQAGTAASLEALPEDAIVLARAMGAAELLDYDRSRLRGLIVEEASPQSHVAIVAKALGIAAVGQVRGVMERAEPGDEVVVDADTGEVHIRPSSDLILAYSEKARFRAARQEKYRALRDKPAVSRDGVPFSISINAGLLMDVDHLAQTNADGIGLFRTELQFMVSETFPRLDRQTKMYQAVMDGAGGKPVVFRALDIGGDKTLPYLRQPNEENPAIGWRAIRMALDRPGLFRTQVRALMRAASGRPLHLLIPMVSTVEEIDRLQMMIERERTLLMERGGTPPERLYVGAMIEVPSLLHDMDRLAQRVDFMSVGSNDLMQYLFAADRTNEKVAGRYDNLAVPALRVLRDIRRAADRLGVPVALCGEMAGHPVEAMALAGIGYRSISMSAAAVGPVKAMLMSLDVGRLEGVLASWLDEGGRAPGDMRAALVGFANDHGVSL